jgi:hypothetical protein
MSDPADDRAGSLPPPSRWLPPEVATAAAEPVVSSEQAHAEPDGPHRRVKLSSPAAPPPVASLPPLAPTPASAAKWLPAEPRDAATSEAAAVVEPEATSRTTTPAGGVLRQSAGEDDPVATEPPPAENTSKPRSTKAKLSSTKAKLSSRKAKQRSIEPEPTAVEPEPEPTAIEPEPEPEPTAAEPEPEPTAAEPEPEPTAAEPEPEPTAVEPEPEPTAAEPEPEPTAADSELLASERGPEPVPPGTMFELPSATAESSQPLVALNRGDDAVASGADVSESPVSDGDAIGVSTSEGHADETPPTNGKTVLPSLLASGPVPDLEDEPTPFPEPTFEVAPSASTPTAAESVPELTITPEPEPNTAGPTVEQTSGKAASVIATHPEYLVGGAMLAGFLVAKIVVLVAE